MTCLRRGSHAPPRKQNPTPGPQNKSSQGTLSVYLTLRGTKPPFLGLTHPSQSLLLSCGPLSTALDLSNHLPGSQVGEVDAA